MLSKLSDLKEAEYNPRTITDESFKGLKYSIDEFGDLSGIVFNERTGNLVAGHQRAKAIKAKYGNLEIVGDEIRVPNGDIFRIRLVDWDVSKEKAANVAANNPHIQGEFNSGLGSILEELKIDLPDYSTNLQMDKLKLDIEEIDLGNIKVEKEEKQLFSEEQIFHSLIKEFPEYASTLEITKGIITEAMAMAQFNRLASGYDDGYYISALFNSHRFSTRTNRNISVYEAFSKKKFKENGARYLTRYENGRIHPSQYIKYCGVGWGGIRSVFEFKPKIARDIYLNYTKEKDSVLDPCAGWGGRLIGAYSTNFSLDYFAAEPSSETFNGLKKLIQFLDRSEAICLAEIVNQPFEEVKLNKKFDFAFTSPPYFDTERYSDEDSQSWVRYKTYAEWEENFLFVLLKKTLDHLKPNKYFLINVGDNLHKMTKSIESYCSKNHHPFRYVDSYKIGGSGIGARSNTEKSIGEAFIEIENHV